MRFFFECSHWGLIEITEQMAQDLVMDNAERLHWTD